MNFRIRPYRPEDECAALDIESRCVQGGSLALRFERKSFAARSLQFEQWSILVAETADGKVVGLTAWASKPARLLGVSIRTAVHYDLRVDPDFRGLGIAQALMGAALEEADPYVPFHYALAAGQNRAVARAIDRFGRAYREWPLRYLCFPSASPAGTSRAVADGDPGRVRDASTDLHPADLYFEGPPDGAEGWAGSFEVADGHAAASAWDASACLAERIVRLPAPLRLAAAVSARLRFAPRIPRPGERLDPWFLYDVRADSDAAAALLVDAVRSAARDAGRTICAALLPPTDARLDRLARATRLSFRLPYRLLVTGRQVPEAQVRVRVDPRDL